MARTLREGQARAVLWLMDHRRGALLLPMGFGKTFTVLSALAGLGWPRTLIVAPKTVACRVWPVELGQAFPGRRFTAITGDETPARRLDALVGCEDVLILSSTQLTWLVSAGTRRAYRERTGRWPAPFEAVVVDELSQYKDGRSARFRALNSITGGRRVRPRWVWGLTGTPVADRYDALIPEFRIVDCGATLGTSVEAFRRVWLRPVNPWSDWPKYEIASPELESLLWDRVGRVALTARSEDVAGLFPARTDVVVDVHPPAGFMGEYARFAADQVTDVLGWEPVHDSAGARVGRAPVLGPDVISAPTAAVLRNKLRQFTAGFLYREDGSVRWFGSAKLDRAVELIDSLNGDPVLVFYEFVAERDELLRRVPGAVTIDGPGYSQGAWDSGRIPVLLAHPASAGHGLNLQRGASQLLWLTLPESNDLRQQAEARLIRPGARGDSVWVHRLRIPGTVDDLVADDKAAKSAVGDRLLAHLRSMVERGR